MRQNRAGDEEIRQLEQQLDEQGANNAKLNQIIGLSPSFGDEAGAETFKLQLQNKDLLMQVEALNAINATLKSRVDKSGGKQISKE